MGGNARENTKWDRREQGLFFKRQQLGKRKKGMHQRWSRQGKRHLRCSDWEKRCSQDERSDKGKSAKREKRTEGEHPGRGRRAPDNLKRGNQPNGSRNKKR